MAAQYKIESDGSISITVKITPVGSYLEQEEQIAEAVSEVGRLASQIAMSKQDTDGSPIIVGNQQYTTRGQEKKNIKPPGVQ